MDSDKKIDIYRVQNWYPNLAVNSFPSVFVMLRPEEVTALADGKTSGPVVEGVLPRLDSALRTFSGNRFVSVDLAAPTDTERFRSKRGAVKSASSAWGVLAESMKVRSDAMHGKVSCICVRPFRRLDQTKEFRLFIKDGKLNAMSQYWLIRHFRRLVKYQEKYWTQARNFVDSVSWALPAKDIVADIYFTSQGKVLVIDLNQWGPPTDPLMLNTWNRDWNQEGGYRIVPAPHTLSGDVNVSF